MSPIEIPVRGGLIALVDEVDGDLRSHSWRQSSVGKNRTVYARRSIRSGHQVLDLLMHREIAARMGLDLTLQVDHRDGNGLNNCRSNLRSATASQNVAAQKRSVRSQSGFRGVHRSSAKAGMVSSPWRAEIKVRGTTIHLGWFGTAEEAATAYDAAAREHFGEFAVTNDGASQ